MTATTTPPATDLDDLVDKAAKTAAGNPNDLDAQVDAATIPYKPNGTADLSRNRIPGATSSAALTGAARGVMDLPGMVGDLFNYGELGLGKLFNSQSTQDDAHARMRGDGKFAADFMPPSTPSFDKLYDEMGWFNKPADDNRGAWDAGKFSGNLVAGASLGGPTKALNPLALDAEKAGVTLPSTILGKTYGAQGIVRDAQTASQEQIANYGKRLIDTAGGPTTQEIGAKFAAQVPRVIESLTNGVADAYKELGAVAPDFVDTTNIQTAMRSLDKIDDPVLRSALGDNPVLRRFGDVFAGGRADKLSWGDMSALSTEIGKSFTGATGSELGVLKQLYRAINEDLRAGVSQVEGGTDAFKAAREAVKTKTDLLDDILTTMESKNPEMLPDWLTQQASKGNSRLQAFNEHASPQEWDALGSWLLKQKSYTNGQFDPAALSKYLGEGRNSLSPEANQSLFHQDMADDLDRFQKLYQGTQKGRDLLASPMTTDAPGVLTGGATGGFIGHLLGHPEVGAAIGAAATKAYPLIAGGAAKITSNPSLMNPLSAIGRGAVSAGAPNALIRAPYFTPPPTTPQPPDPEKHSEWISDPSVSTADKVAYVGSKLPQIASQLNTGSPEGDGAALTLAMLNPQFRSQLS